ncbi:hypothetical protein D9619_003200 [Psilocybe cf. subviscida]|uniref:YDG domain-containing protein n=1 Tax=Psilocybe cf. subviscida TaxID=2480587 RepID=A0A8H5AVX7_9AGAR|nr:hypothetical protein D9619_003200 [Psilocybe cf. subviscida]
MVSEYERMKAKNMAEVKALMESFRLPLVEPVEKSRKKPAASRKRKQQVVEEEENSPDEDNAMDSKPTKVQRVEIDSSAPEPSLRRSSRNSGKVIDYRKEIVKDSPLPVAYSSGVKKLENEGPLGREDGRRIHDPKTYGSIPGIEVGTWWEGRKGCSVDAIHAPIVAGIAFGKQGAYSVALSGGYDDDVDMGYAFTYTGSGGRDLKGTKANPKNLRTAPQSSDQTFENPANKALQVSCKTKKPIRVIRGFKGKSHYAPSEGYRYDGLYRVEKAWMEEGVSGFQVCKYAFKRLPNQAAIPIRAGGGTGGANAVPEVGEDAVDEDTSEVKEDDEEENAEAQTEEAEPSD